MLRGGWPFSEVEKKREGGCIYVSAFTQLERVVGFSE